MRYLAAYLLLNSAGNVPNSENIKSVLESVGIEVDDEKVKAVLSALDGKSVEELVAEGSKKIANASCGTVAAASGDKGTVAEAPAEEVEEEVAEESDDDMGFGLFD